MASIIRGRATMTTTPLKFFMVTLDRLVSDSPSTSLRLTRQAQTLPMQILDMATLGLLSWGRRLLFRLRRDRFVGCIGIGATASAATGAATEAQLPSSAPTAIEATAS
jgi:hypothetical protein